MDILILPDDTIYFYVHIYITDYFDNHYHAYCIHKSVDVYKYVDIKCLANSFVYHAYKNFDKQDHSLYVVPKYGIAPL